MKQSNKVLAAIMLMTAVLVAGCTPEQEPINNGGNNNGGGGTNDEVTVITTTPQDIALTSAVCGGAVSLSEGITLSEVGVCWSTNSTPTVSESHVSAAGSVEEQFTCTLSGLEPDTKYYVRAYALCGEKYYYGNAKNFTTLNNGGSYNGHDYVDLGLPSGTLWATCNVGATTPEGYGGYFAWGETQPKDFYEWCTYQHCNRDFRKLIKYCCNSYYGYYGITDTLTVLQPSDDAATANWGEGWCMPTADQQRELYQNTIHTWTTQNGVNGMLFTASNGNSLFLPAAGFRLESWLCEVGSEGAYWSSSLDTDYSCAARNFSFYLDEYRFSDPRDRGQSVRAVRSSR